MASGMRSVWNATKFNITKLTVSPGLGAVICHPNMPK